MSETFTPGDFVLEANEPTRVLYVSVLLSSRRLVGTGVPGAVSGAALRIHNGKTERAGSLQLASTTRVAPGQDVLAARGARSK